LRMGEVEGVARASDGSAVTGVVVDDEPIEADAVVVAMGPWSMLASQWLPLPPVFGLKGNSIVFRTGDAVSPHVLFVDYGAADGAMHTPEVFPGPDGTTYVGGLSSEMPLPPSPADVAPDAGAREELRAMASRFSPVLASAEIMAV